jgi:HAD superfamily phosphatase (TIGR01681 family)
MLSYRADVYESEYDVIDSEVLDENSGLYESARDIVIIYMSPQKAYESFTSLEMPKRSSFAEEYAGRIRGYWDTLKERTSSAIIQFGMNGINGHVMGDFANRQEDSFEFQLEKLKYLMMCEAAKREGVYLLDLDRIERILGRDAFTDMRFYYDARMAISTEALPYVAKGVYDIALAIKGQIKKCVIFDLDNTIWGGVIGDDLLSGIELGELGDGRIYSDIQRYLLELKKRGIILAVCSKNDEETAKEPFLRHPDMILSLDDIAVFVANWEDKASNIRYIQETLNIGNQFIKEFTFQSYGSFFSVKNGIFLFLKPLGNVSFTGS